METVIFVLSGNKPLKWAHAHECAVVGAHGITSVDALVHVDGCLGFSGTGVTWRLGGFCERHEATIVEIKPGERVKKRIFSSQALAELGKAIAKKTLLVGGVFGGLLNVAPHGEYMNLMQQSGVQQALANALQLAAQAALLMVLTLNRRGVD